MVLGSLAFALMGELTHALRTSLDWQLVALARSLLGLFFASALALAAGRRLVVLRPRALWMRSLAGSVSLLCNFYALTHLPVSDVLTLTNTFPLWVAVLSWPLLGTAPTGRVWLAVAAGVLGVVLVQQPHLAGGNLAAVVALAAGLSTALAMIGLHRLEGIDPWAIVAHFAGVSALFCVGSLLFSGAAGPDRPGPAGPTLLLLLGVGVTATVGQWFLTRAFAAGSPAKVAVVGLSQVVFAVVLDLLLWDRSLSPGVVLGIVLVLAPTGWVLLTRRADEAEVCPPAGAVTPARETPRPATPPTAPARR